MADNFGNSYLGRVYEGGKFYAVASIDVPANAVYCPSPAGSGQFGIAEYPVAKGEIGSFATEGTFAFKRPAGWTSSPGNRVYYNPTTAVEGTFVRVATNSTICIGYEVVRPGIPADQIWVTLTHGFNRGYGAAS